MAKPSVSSPSAFRLSHLLPWLATGIAVFTACWLASRNFTLNGDLEDERLTKTQTSLELQATHQQLEAEQILGQGEISSLHRAILAADLAQLQITRLLPTADAEEGTQGTVIWNPITSQGLVVVTHLISAGADDDYQLWIYPSAPPALPTSGGVITMVPATGDGRLLFKSDRPPGNFTLTREHPGGATQPTGRVVLKGP